LCCISGAWGQVFHYKISMLYSYELDSNMRIFYAGYKPISASKTHSKAVTV
jgi:hypothetical protein